MPESANNGVVTVPDLPESHRESAQTAPTIISTVPAVVPPRSEYLGQDLAADYSEIVQVSDQVILNRAAVSALNSHVMTLKEGKKRAEDDLAVERTQNKSLMERATTSERNAAVLTTQLGAERQSNNMRTVMIALGCVALGFIPYAGDKAGAVGGVIVGVFGVVLIVSAWRFGSKAGAQ